jgi:hypothetical protein
VRFHPDEAVCTAIRTERDRPADPNSLALGSGNLIPHPFANDLTLKLQDIELFKTGTGDWTQYRRRDGVTEVDFHRSEFGPRDIPYWEAMVAVRQETLTALKSAYERGDKWVLFRHGSSTSRLGKQTARSEVRGLMRSKEATPYICRRECIQHETVFVAAIRSRR